MKVRADFYRKRERKEAKNVRSEFAASRYAETNGYDGFVVRDGGEERFYMKPRYGKQKGKGWLGPIDEGEWLYSYMGLRKTLSPTNP